MDSVQDESIPPMTPADEFDDDFDLAPQTSWPKVIGIISVIYASLGLVCGVGGALVQTFMIELFLGMGGMDVAVPVQMKILAGISAVATLILGLILLFGAINLLRRRPQGVSMHKTWAVLRLVWVVIGVGMGMYTMPAQMDFQEEMYSAQVKMMRDNGQDPSRLGEFNRESKAMQQTIVLGVVTALTAVYPLFIGFYMVRQKVSDETATWI